MKLTLGSHEFNVPTKWQELTLGQMTALGKYAKHIAADPALKLACMITRSAEPGTVDEPESPYGLLWRCDVNAINGVMPLTDFIDTAFNFGEQPKPEQVTIAGKQVQVPTDLSMKTLGQKIISEDAIKKSGIEGTAMVIATYLQPLISGEEFNIDKAKELIPEVFQMLAIEAVPLADFFLNSSQPSIKKLNTDVTSS